MSTAGPEDTPKFDEASWTAASVSMRGVTTPLRESVISFPVSRRTPTIPAGERSGRAWRSSVMAPAAAGVDADVPLKVTAPPPFVTTFQKAPGARSERLVVELEKQTIESGVTGESVHRTPPLSSAQATRV